MKTRKMITAFMVAFLMVTSSFLSACSTEYNGVNGNITVTSSAAETAAATIAAKLPELSYEVILGTEETAASYGVDLSGFESDGYIIREQEDTVLLFGKTEEGLTTAANKFVNQYRADKVEDVSFHEGYRIEKLEIFGTDISEYVIEYPAEKNANVSFAVSELQRLVKTACGATLAATNGDSGAEHVIEFRVSDDAELKDEGYRYFEENGTLVLEGARARGSMNAVYRFLQNECGWDQLTGGDSMLRESDHINIPEGISKTETPTFEYLFIHCQTWEQFRNERRNPQYDKAPITHACHGLYGFVDDTIVIDRNIQPCYSAEETYEVIFANVEKYIEGQIAAGRTPGVDLIEIDIAQLDSGDYCTCGDCMEIFYEEGGHAGAVVRFANRLSEEMDEKYPGIVYKIFAYANTNRPPMVTMPNDLLYITYCFDMNCSNHPLDASECGDGETRYNRKNVDYAEWFEGWCDISPNIYVWFYALDTNFHDYTVVDTIYNDYVYLAKNGVKGVFHQSTDHGLGTKSIEHQLAYELNWNINMTEEEYYALYEKLLEKEYGAGWKYVYEYLDNLNALQDMMGCWDCWGWTEPALVCEKYYNTGEFAMRYDHLVDIMDEAIAMAETPEEVKCCEMLMISVLYKGCYSSYFKEYELGNTERIDVLSDRFDRAMSLMRKYGFTMYGGVGKYMSVDGFFCEFHYNSIEDAAWLDWIKCREDLWPGSVKPAPAKYTVA